MTARTIAPTNAGIGIYTLPEAAHLIGAPTLSVRRWLQGYRFTSGSGVQHASPPLFRPQLPAINKHQAIGFLDLVELLFIKGFRQYGLPLQTIRAAAKEAGRRWETDHPFCMRRFATDGKQIFATLVDDLGEEHLMELTKQQYTFAKVINPYLKQLDFAEQCGVHRWWPMGKTKHIVLDPQIAFGRPLVDKCAIPTEALYEAFLTNRSEKTVSDWYDIPIQAVKAAIAFEEHLAA